MIPTPLLPLPPHPPPDSHTPTLPHHTPRVHTHAQAMAHARLPKPTLEPNRLLQHATPHPRMPCPRAPGPMSIRPLVVCRPVPLSCSPDHPRPYSSLPLLHLQSLVSIFHLPPHLTLSTLRLHSSALAVSVSLRPLPTPTSPLPKSGISTTRRLSAVPTATLETVTSTFFDLLLPSVLPWPILIAHPTSSIATVRTLIASLLGLRRRSPS